MSEQQDTGSHHDGKDYDVGYKRPPKHGQFQPGKSGNTKGRPKKPQDFMGQLKNELKVQVSVQEGGRTCRFSKAELIVKSLVNAAAKGNSQALKLLLPYMKEHIIPEQLETDAGTMETWLSYLNRHQMKQETSNDNATDPRDAQGDVSE